MLSRPKWRLQQLRLPRPNLICRYPLRDYPGTSALQTREEVREQDICLSDLQNNDQPHNETTYGGFDHGRRITIVPRPNLSRSAIKPETTPVHAEHLEGDPGGQRGGYHPDIVFDRA
jgi:hypothetical protein